MSDVGFPRRITDITPTWLTQLLTEEGLLTEGRVTSVEVDRLSVGSGFIGRVVRLLPSYESPNAAVAPSFALKIPTGEQKFRARFQDLYNREGRFYDELAAETPLRVPRCYWNAHDRDASDFALLLEDLSHLKVGDRAEASSEAESEMVVTHLARMQARWWGSEELAARSWLRPMNEWRAGFSHEALRDCVPTFVGAFGDLLPRGFDRVLDRVLASLDELWEPLPGVPPTLVHGDFRIDNMMFGEPSTEDELVVFDWQFVSVGPGRWDLCYFLAHNLTIELRRETETSLLETYHSVLTGLGVRGYTFEQCIRDYRLGLLLALLQPLGMEVFRLSNVQQLEALEGERREMFAKSAEAFFDLQRTMTERNVAAVVDNGAASLLVDDGSVA